MRAPFFRCLLLTALAALPIQAAGPDVQPQPARIVTGRVLDADTGKPLPNARVEGEAASALTDAEGRFRIELPPRSRGLFLTASAEGYVKADWFPESNNPATFALRRAGGLAGAVVDVGGRPVARARVRALPVPAGSVLDEPPSGEARTEADGRFRIPDLRAGWTYFLRVDGGDFAPARQIADVPPADKPGKPVRITVTPGTAASGRVVDQAGQPVPGAAVRLRPAHQEDESWSEEDSTPLEGLSGPDGRFLLSHLAAGRYDLQIEREGLSPGRIAGLEIPSGSRAVDLGDVRLKAGGFIEGRVLDESGRPVAGAHIGLSLPMERMNERPPQAETGPDGSFRLKGLARGERYDLWIQADGFVQRQAPGVEAPPSEPLRIELRRGRTLTVRVVDPEGKPVARALLSRMEKVLATGPGAGYGHQSTGSLGETDDEGSLRIGNLEPGVLDLLVQADGFQPLVAPGLHIPDESDAGAVEVTLVRGAVLEGQVLDGDGKAVVGASVQASLESVEVQPYGVGMLPATTDGEGRYRLEGLTPGSYQVTVRSVELSDTLWGKAEVDAGVHRLDFRFPSGAQVSGQVLDSRGVPVPRASLSLVPVGGGYISNTVGRADGTFTFRAVPDGDFHLRGSAPGFALTVEPGEVRVSGGPVRGLLLRLNRGVSITGRLLGVDPDRLAGTSIVADVQEQRRYEVHHGTVNREGIYRIANATPGRWNVTAQLPDGRSAKGRVEVTEADTESVTLDLEFEAGLTLSGRVLLDGEPLAGGSIAVDGRSSTIAYDGRFSVPGLEPGQHRLDVVVGPGLGQALRIEMTRDEEMTIPLSTGSIEGRVLSPEGLPLGGALVEVAAEQPDLNASFEGLQVLTSEDGAFQLSRCIAGSYRLRVHAEGFPLAEAHVLVPPGGTVHTEIALEIKP